MSKAGYMLALLAIAASSVWSQKETPQPDADGVYPAQKGVTSAKLVRAVSAVAPEDPSSEGLRHVCALSVVIGAEGVPGAIEIVNKMTTPFDGPAEAAVRQSLFEAGSSNGKPVPTRLMVWVPFLGKDHSAIPVAGGVNTIRNFKAPVPIFAPQAEFSDAAKSRHAGGAVVVRVLVTEEGLPTRLQVVVHAGNGLDEKALEAVSKYRFRPALLEGVPVPMMFSVEVNFRTF